MTRTTWLVLSALVLTNAVWALTWFSRSDEPPTADADTVIADLQQENEALRLRAEAAERLAPPEGGALRAPEAPPVEEGKTDPSTEETEADAADEAAKARAEADATRKAQQAALATAREILRKVMQVEDAALRDEGIEELAEALSGDDATLIEYTLGALWSAKDIDIDRVRFAQLVEPHLRSEHPGIRRSALYVIHAMDPSRADLSLALASATDEADTVRHHAGRILALYTGKQFEGETAKAMADLLADESVTVRRGTVRGLSHARITPEIEARLIEMAQRPEERHDAVYFGLSTVPDKSRKVVDALFTYLMDDNVSTRGRAHWGLQRGIPEDQHSYVASRYADHLTKFVSPKSHEEALKMIARYGDDRVIPKIEAFAENSMVDPKVREMARKVVAYVQNKKGDR
ncbi:MAG: hypothetical protein QNJ98_07025 [Planctomycetota bacterium]|nr:hypothetical protein [Planctomycetota bacterium]